MQRLFIQKGVVRGMGLLEVVVSVSIVAVVLVFFSNTFVQFINTGKQVTEKTQALYLAEEGLELMRFVRDYNWADISALTGGTSYALLLNPTTIGITTTPEVSGIFKRTFVVSNVYRNASTDDIVASTTVGAVADAQAKYITMNVAWGTPTSTISLTTILTHLDL